MELFAHQERGAKWLAARRRSMLLDEQGLGKTITAIAAADLVRARFVLVIVPPVVLWKWESEFETWSPARFVQVLDNGKRRIDPHADVIITTHTLILSPMIRAQILSRRWSFTILDEAHFFRSHDAQRVAVMYGEHGEDGESIVGRSTRFVAMTGTPMPNDCSELWPHFFGMFPELLGDPTMSYEQFRAFYCITRPTQYGTQILRNHEGTIGLLKNDLNTVSLRRLKRVELPHLPSVRKTIVKLRPKVLPSEIVKLSALLSKKVSKSLAELDEPTPGLELAALGSSTEFASFRRLCGIAKIAPAVELVSPELEFDAIDKIVIFAHHSDVVEGLVSGLERFGVVSIVGATPAKKRASAVEQFQTDPAIRVVVCQIVAGGTGTTLTMAADVLFVELSPVPGENAQAQDRVHRIGQTRRVLIRVLSLAGTLDEVFTDLNTRKTANVREVLPE